MATVSVNGFPFSTCREQFLSKKKTSTNLFFYRDQTSKNFSSGLHLSSKNGRKSDIVKKDSLTTDQPSSKMHDGLGIVNFFNGKKLLITGATGFLAKGIRLIGMYCWLLDFFQLKSASATHFSWGVQLIWFFFWVSLYHI